MNGKKILIIDDEHTLLRLSQIIFQRKGFDVLAALSVKEGQNYLLQGECVDLIVLDLMLPEANGFDFLAWKEEQTEPIKSIPTVVNTAKNISDQEKMYLNLHCKKIMNKGIDFTDRLLAEVEAILKP